MTVNTGAVVDSASEAQAGEVAASRKKAPAWARFHYEATERLLELGGGPRVATLQWAVNFHKVSASWGAL